MGDRQIANVMTIDRRPLRYGYPNDDRMITPDWLLGHVRGTQTYFPTMLFNPGTGTLKSTTVEGALVEAMVLLQIAEEAAQIIDPTIRDTVAVNYFTGDKTVTLDIGVFPVAAVNTASGVSYQGKNYFNAVSAPTFSNTGSDLLATTLFAAVTELALKLEAAELAQPVEDGKNISTSSINTSTNIFTFAAQLNVTMTQTATGATQFDPVAYLP
jgi:hypothetical protein